MYRLAVGALVFVLAWNWLRVQQPLNLHPYSEVGQWLTRQAIKVCKLYSVQLTVGSKPNEQQRRNDMPVASAVEQRQTHYIKHHHNLDRPNKSISSNGQWMRGYIANNQYYFVNYMALVDTDDGNKVEEWRLYWLCPPTVLNAAYNFNAFEITRSGLMLQSFIPITSSDIVNAFNTVPDSRRRVDNLSQLVEPDKEPILRYSVHTIVDTCLVHGLMMCRDDIEEN